MDAMTALTTRRSWRHYAPDRPIDRAILEKIIDAGRLAATAINRQPWEFVVVTEPAGRAAIADLTDHGKFIAEAAACVVVLCRDTHYYLEDGSAATQNLLVAAAAHGVQSCWVAGDKKAYGPSIVEAVGAPPEMKLVSLVALGYGRGDAPSVNKRPLTEVLHWERF